MSLPRSRTCLKTVRSGPPRWRPIATAPKEEPIILLYPSDGRAMVWQGYIDVVGSALAVDPVCASVRVFPTHWQPLPRPPARLPRTYSRHG